METEDIAKQMLIDALNAIEALYGQKGLDAVVTHMKCANKVREDNIEMDFLEKVLSR